jgi:uracil-DNA glycosylase
LTVGSHPRRLENACGNVIADGSQGANLLSSVKRFWRGLVASCYAVGCYPGPDEGRDKAEPKHAEKCRPYLRSYAEQVAPKRILALGELACWGLLGRSISTRSVRRGFAWVRLPHGRVPVLILMDPQKLDGRHARAAWETDLEWALTTPDSFFEERLRFLEDGTYSVITDKEDAKEAAAVLRAGALELVNINGSPEHNGLSWDVETVGKMHDEDFKIISAAVSVRGSNHAFVWDRPACTGLEVRQPLVDLIADPDLTFVEQGSYDENAALCYFQTGIGGQRRDTRLLRKALDSDVRKADLGTLSELVGMGGYKDEFDAEKEAVRQQVKKWKPNQLAPAPI